MENINVAELLKDCPKGMELYSPIFGKVYLDKIRPHLAIVVTTDKEQSDSKEEFLYDGRYRMNGECMLFPSKGKTSWDGFVPPCTFKDGDVLTYMYHNKPTIYIYRENGSCNTSYYAGYSFDNERFYKTPNGGLSGDRTDLRLATEEEKQKLFKAIKDNGYRWNAETMTLENLVEPIFNIGDSITHLKLNHVVYTVTRITDTHYTVIPDGKYVYEYTIPISTQYNYEKVSLKFNYNTLVPFESKVLIRHDKEDKWIPSFWGFKTDNGYITTFGWWRYCIPYEGNEHLLGKTDDCDEYYKTWL